MPDEDPSSRAVRGRPVLRWGGCEDSPGLRGCIVSDIVFMLYIHLYMLRCFCLETDVLTLFVLVVWRPHVDACLCLMRRFWIC